MPTRLASSPGWLQSVVLYFCQGLQQVRLFIDDIACFLFHVAEHVRDLARFLERLTKLDPKLGPKKVDLGVRVLKLSGHRVTSERDGYRSWQGRSTPWIAYVNKR